MLSFFILVLKIECLSHMSYSVKYLVNTKALPIVWVTGLCINFIDSYTAPNFWHDFPEIYNLFLKF